MEAKPQIKLPRRVIGYKALFTKLLEQIGEGRKVTIRATGWSMLPLIWDDRDTITLGPLSPDSIRVGRIVLAQLGTGRYVVHRISKIRGSRVVLRGDGNPYQEEYVHHDKVLAELVGIRREGKDLGRKDLLWRLCTTFWPSHGFVRRVLLFAYRRMVVRPAPRQERRLL